MLSTQGRANNDKKESPFISYGTGEYKINKFEVINNGKGAERVAVHFESRPVTTTGFTPSEDATAGGKIGRAYLTIYMNPEKPSFANSLEEFQNKIASIANAMGAREEVDALSAPTLVSYIAMLNGILTNKFAYWCVSAEEYAGQDKDGAPKTKFILTIPRWRFVSDEDNLSFDKTKAYHYKKLATESTEDVFSAMPDGDDTW